MKNNCYFCIPKQVLTKKTNVMKRFFYAVALLITANFMLSSCEDKIEEGLLKDLAEGKMVIVVNEGSEEILECNFGHFGEGTELTGEVFISASLPTSTEKFFTIMYGSYSNEQALAVKTYSTAVEADMMTIMGSYGFSHGEESVVSIEIIEITATAIKGTFKGSLEGMNGLQNVEGAFWAVKGEEQPH